MVHNSTMGLYLYDASKLDYPLHRYTLWNKHIECSLGAGTQQLRTLGARLGRTTYTVSAVTGTTATPSGRSYP